MKKDNVLRGEWWLNLESINFCGRDLLSRPQVRGYAVKHDYKPSCLTTASKGTPQKARRPSSGTLSAKICDPFFTDLISQQLY